MRQSFVRKYAKLRKSPDHFMQLFSHHSNGTLIYLRLTDESIYLKSSSDLIPFVHKVRFVLTSCCFQKIIQLKKREEFERRLNQVG